MHIDFFAHVAPVHPMRLSHEKHRTSDQFKTVNRWTDELAEGHESNVFLRLSIKWPDLWRGIAVRIQQRDMWAKLHECARGRRLSSSQLWLASFRWQSLILSFATKTKSHRLARELGHLGLRDFLLPPWPEVTRFLKIDGELGHIMIRLDYMRWRDMLICSGLEAVVTCVAEDWSLHWSLDVITKGRMDDYILIHMYVGLPERKPMFELSEKAFTVMARLSTSTETKRGECEEIAWEMAPNFFCCRTTFSSSRTLRENCLRPSCIFDFNLIRNRP